MKFSTTREKILNTILLAERITGKKESLPVLTCILFDVQKNISVRATNLEAGVEITVPGEISEKGIVAVPSGTLSQTLRAISGDSVHFSLDEGNLRIESRGTKTLIKAIPHAEFPPLPAVPDKPGLTISRERLIRAIQAVSYAASPSMIRPELGSVYVVVKDGALTCVATDSFRLAEKSINDIGVKENTDVLVPLRHALELVHVLERLTETETVTIATEESQLTVFGSGVRYISRIVDSTFPNYRDIIPKASKTEAVILKNDLSELLRKARVFSGNEQHIGFHVYPKKKIFTVTAHASDIGEMSDSVDAALSGEDLDINFHIGYLAECLSSIASDSVTLAFAGEGRPLVVRGVSDNTFMYLVMPLNR